MTFKSPFLNLLKNRINLWDVPFTERGSRLLVFRGSHYLSVRLAERWFKHEGALSAYRSRPPIIDEWVFTDEEGRLLEFTLTTNPHQLEVATRVGVFILIFLDTETLLVRLPRASCGIAFNANLDHAHPDRRGGVLRLTGDIRRNVAYTTNARILTNQVETLSPSTQRVSLGMDASQGCALLLNITPRLGFNRYIPDPDAAIEAAARRWHQWFHSVPSVLEPYRAQYYFAWWIMRAGLISTRFYTTREAMTPSKLHYVGVWGWDSYFHALAYRHVDHRLAQDQLRILLDHQREDGLIPDAVHDEGIVTHLTFPVDADVTKPPLIAWAAWKLYEKDPDREFLEEIYEPILRWNDWWFEKNDPGQNGLCEYSHPFSSGLDDSPLWDDGMPAESPDLNTYLCMQLDTMAKIARVIDREEDAAAWEQRASDLAERMVQLQWDNREGLFWASHNGRRINVRTPFNLFPLITGRMPEEISERLVKHLTDPEKFWPRFPVPSVALDDPKYNPDQMWRGPTWVNINYLLIEGLFNAGYPDVARDLRSRTLDLIGSQQDIYEYYNPQTGSNPPKAAAIFGWSSAVFIDLAIAVSQEEAAPRKKEKP